MQRTLLIGHNGVNWREWLKTNRGDQPFICLEPSDPLQSPPGRFTLTVGEKTIAWRFYGSLDAQRAPHILLTALFKLVAASPQPPIVQFPAYRPYPLLRQTLLAACELFQPERVLVAKGTEIDRNGFTVGPEEVELERSFPPVVVNAQRKAQWIKLADEAITHIIPFDQLTIEGTRLGSGTAVRAEEIQKLAIPELLYAETMGSSLLAVSKRDLDEHSLAKLSDHFETHRAVVSAPDSYWGLLCSFARETGEDFGIGFVERVDFAARAIQVRNTAVEGAPVRILRIGTLRLDSAGNELGEVKPWQV